MDEKILEDLGNRIRQLRTIKHITQQELAEKCDLSLPFINLIENNKRNVSLETLIKILVALDVSLSDFFKPYSVSQEDGLSVLIDLLQTSNNKDEYIEMFTKILDYAKK